MGSTLRRRKVRSSKSRQASVRVNTLVLALFLLGACAGVGYLVYLLARKPAHLPAGVAKEFTLSENTRAILNRLEIPVEIRFYSVLDPETVPAPLQAYPQRVRRLLAEYERAANDNLKVRVFESRSDSDAQAAAKEGVTAFNREKGNASFLGLVVEQDGRKEVLPRLSPAWEQALEADVTRAIERVANRRATVARPGVSPAKPQTLEAVKRAFPDLGSVSLEEGTRQLRESALQEFRRAVEEMGPALKAAEQRLQETLQSGSPAEQDAARRELQQVQARHAEKLKEIAARSQAEIEALRELKQGQ